MPERLTVRSGVPKSAAMVDAVCTTFPQVTSRKSAYPCSYASSGSHGGGEVATILNSRPPPPSCTLETYAGAKSLPVEFLKSPGLSDVTYSGSAGMRELRPSPALPSGGPSPKLYSHIVASCELRLSALLPS